MTSRGLSKLLGAIILIIVAILGISTISADPSPRLGSEPAMFAFAKTFTSSPKATWNLVAAQSCSINEPGATDGRVRCAYEEPGDEPSFALPPMDQWSAPVSILD